MNLGHHLILLKAVEKALERISIDGHPGYIYEDLARDMADASALVYDASMRGQAFAKEQ